MELVSLITTAFAMLTGSNIVVGMLLLMIFGLAFALKWVWNKYDALRIEAAQDVKELQSQITELNSSYTESNNRTADTLDKIGQTILKLVDLTSRK